jgi:hypothetical protein
MIDFRVRSNVFSVRIFYTVVAYDVSGSHVQEYLHSFIFADTVLISHLALFRGPLSTLDDMGTKTRQVDEVTGDCGTWKEYGNR